MGTAESAAHMVTRVDYVVRPRTGPTPPQYTHWLLSPTHPAPPPPNSHKHTRAQVIACHDAFLSRVLRAALLKEPHILNAVRAASGGREGVRE